MTTTVKTDFVIVGTDTSERLFTALYSHCARQKFKVTVVHPDIPHKTVQLHLMITGIELGGPKGSWLVKGNFTKRDHALHTWLGEVSNFEGLVNTVDGKGWLEVP